jgi:hypothetical protein
VIALLPRLGMTGVLLGVAALPPSGLFAAFVRHRHRYRAAFRPAPAPRFDAGAFRRMARVAAAALALALCDQGVLVATRAHYVRAYGAAANGLLQAGLALSQQGGSVFYAYLASYAFGRVSRAANLPAIRAYTRLQFRACVAVAAFGFGVAMLIAGPVLHLLYSDRFDGARPLMRWMLLGEFAKVAMQAWAIGALSTGGVRLWVPMGLAYTAAIGAGYLLATQLGAGTLALPYAYAAAGFVGLAVAGALLTRRGVTLSAADAALFAGATAALAGIATFAR